MFIEYVFWVNKYPPAFPKLYGDTANVIAWGGVDANEK